MENYNQYAEYAPIIIFVILFIFKHKIFVTPYQLLKIREEITKEIESKYVTRQECIERKGNTEKRLDELLIAVNDIKNYLIKRR